MYIIFRLFRKLKSLIHDFCRHFKILSLYYLSQKRIVINKDIIFGENFNVHTDISKTHIVILENVRVRNNFNIYVGENASLSIGSNNFFNNGCSINCLGTIRLGNNCQLGENVLLYDHNHKYQNKSKLISEQGYDIGQITIGNNCWIGSGVIILKGVTLGDNVIIGAGCVITKSVESNTVIYNHQNHISKSLIDE